MKTMKEVRKACCEIEVTLSEMDLLLCPEASMREHAQGELRDRNQDGSIGMFTSDNFFREKDIIFFIEHLLTGGIDDSGRKFIFTYIFQEHRLLFNYLDEDRPDVLRLLQEKEWMTDTDRDFCSYIDGVARFLVGYIRGFCLNFGFDPSELAGYKIPEATLYHWPEPIPRDTDTVARRCLYKPMPRTQTIPALYAILKKAGINSSVFDKTVIAEVVEALTGGNGKTCGKDTYAYGLLDDDLTKETKTLLKKISIDA